MFEEYIAETWVCPKCGEVSKVRVEEVGKRVFERAVIGGIFEVINARIKTKVTCYKCGSECYTG